MIVRPILLIIATYDIHGGWGIVAFLIALSLFFE
jgi:hypothetical protein